MTTVAVIDYGMGNSFSIMTALQFVGADVVCTNSPHIIRGSDKIVLPGVGSFKKAMQNIISLGLSDVLYDECIINKKPILGICLGMQLLGSFSTEDGCTKGLDFFSSEVIKLNSDIISGIKVPHVGFNTVKYHEQSCLFDGLDLLADFYFTHSYKMIEKEEAVMGYCEYGESFLASFECENIFGTQFHPEKSQRNGLTLLSNFLKLSNA